MFSLASSLGAYQTCTALQGILHVTGPKRAEAPRSLHVSPWGQMQQGIELLAMKLLCPRKPIQSCNGTASSQDYSHIRLTHRAACI